MSARTPPEVEASIVRQYLASGDPVAMIAERHGIDPATAYRVARRAKVKLRTDKWTPTLADLEAAEIAMRREGAQVSTTGLARRLGVSDNKVRRLRADRGELPDDVSPADAAHWARRYRAGESITTIARDEQRNFAVVGATLRASGVEMRPRGRQPKA